MVEVQTTNTGAVIPVETPQTKYPIIVPTRRKVETFRVVTGDGNKEAHERFDLGYRLSWEMNGLGNQVALSKNPDFRCIRQESKFSGFALIDSELTPEILVQEETPKGLVLCVSLYEMEKEQKLKRATSTQTYARIMDLQEAFATTQTGSTYRITPEDVSQIASSLDYGNALHALATGLSSHELQKFPEKLDERVKALKEAFKKAQEKLPEEKREPVPDIFAIYTKLIKTFHRAFYDMKPGDDVSMATDAIRAEFDKRNYCKTHIDAYTNARQMLYQTEAILTLVQLAPKQ